MNSKKWRQNFFIIAIMIVVYYSAMNTKVNEVSDPILGNQVTTISHLNDVKSETELIVYAQDKNDYRIPVRVEQLNQASIIEDIFAIFTTQQNRLPLGIVSPLGPEVTLIQHELNEKVLTLTLSSNAMTYLEEASRAILECLVHTYTSLENIEAVELLVASQDLTATQRMTQQPLTSEMGVNLKLESLDLSGLKPVTLYFYKEIEAQQYLVPVTHLIPLKTDAVMYALENLKLGSLSGDYYTQLDPKTTILSVEQTKENILVLNVDEGIYQSYDEPLVSSALLRQMKQTLIGLEGIEGVLLQVNGDEEVYDDKKALVSEVLMSVQEK